MKEQFLELKAVITAIFGFLGAKLGIEGSFIGLLFGVVVIDYISGVVASGYEGKLSSKQGYKGILKKVSYFAVIASAMVVDSLIVHFFSCMDIDFKLKATLSALVTVWLILNELLSILENVSRLGVRLPSFLEKIIKILIGSVEVKGNESNSKKGDDNDKNSMA